VVLAVALALELAELEPLAEVVLEVILEPLAGLEAALHSLMVAAAAAVIQVRLVETRVAVLVQQAGVGQRQPVHEELAEITAAVVAVETGIPAQALVLVVAL
jgi:hypothetical protein